MNFTLRTRFFMLLMGFMLFCFALNFSADLIHDHILGAGDPEEQHEMPVSEFLTILSFNLAIMPLVLGLGWWLARRMTNPVVEATEMASRISGGQLSERLPVPTGPAELTRMVQALNLAFDRYQDDLERMRRFSAHAAHQLRTPLAALRAQVEVTLNRNRTEQDYQETLHVVLERLQLWSQSVEQMLALSELETGRWSGRFTAVDLASILGRVQDSLSILAEEKGVRMGPLPRGPVTVMGDEILLEQLFANLLDNAIRFTPAGGLVQGRIESLPEHRRANVCIEDTGPGIPSAQRQQVLERFNKGSRPETPGAGLGLAIAVEIARIHQTTLTLRDHAPQGTTIEIGFTTIPAGPIAAT